MLINFSNHPSSLWEQEQLEAAKEYGEVIDIPFPSVDPDANDEEIQQLADHYVHKLLTFSSKQHITVHIMGEMTFTYKVVSQLKELGIECIASTTERDAEILNDGRKISDFQFVRFRKY